MGFPGGVVVKNPPANAGDPITLSLGQEEPLEEEWQPTPVFLPGKFHKLMNVVGYSPWGHKESDMTDYTHTHLKRYVKIPTN